MLLLLFYYVLVMYIKSAAHIILKSTVKDVFKLTRAFAILFLVFPGGWHVHVCPWVVFFYHYFCVDNQKSNAFKDSWRENANNDHLFDNVPVLKLRIFTSLQPLLVWLTQWDGEPGWTVMLFHMGTFPSPSVSLDYRSHLFQKWIEQNVKPKPKEQQAE